MKNAFTLAEVLITLGIIGIVAALTLPNIIANVKYKKNEVRLKAAYSGLEQGLAYLRLEDIPIYQRAHYHENPQDSLIYAFMQAFEGARTNYSRRPANIYKTFDGTRNYSGTCQSGCFDDGWVELKNSVDIAFESNNHVLIDINGYKNGPNRIGYDAFLFFTAANNTLCMGGNPDCDAVHSDRTLYCSKTSVNASNGVGCTWPALQDPDYFEDLR